MILKWWFLYHRGVKVSLPLNSASKRACNTCTHVWIKSYTLRTRKCVHFIQNGKKLHQQRINNYQYASKPRKRVIFDPHSPLRFVVILIIRRVYQTLHEIRKVSFWLQWLCNFVCEQYFGCIPVKIENMNIPCIRFFS